MYKFVQLNPNLKPGESNPEYQFGVEVTIAVPQGIVNLDHHHLGDTSETPSAAEQALTCELPEDGTVIATVRPDFDSVTAMAIIANRAESKPINISLVTDIGKLDRYGPSVQNTLVHSNIVQAIWVKASDTKIPLGERVAWVQKVLAGEADPEEIKTLVARRETEFEAALKATQIQEIILGKLVLVVSTHRFGTDTGYRHATTVVAFNPEMAVMERNADGALKPTGATYRKFTICRWDSNVPTDMAKALVELQSIEFGWGGRGDIYGSPQNVSSTLSTDEVVEIMRKYVR